MENLRSRWQALDRGAQVAFAGMTVLLAGAVGVRAWLMVSYSPAFLGFPDSGAYALAAAFNIFRDAQRPAGYPFFLRLVHHLSDTMPFTIAVQHALGIATGILLYKAVRRTGAPPWLGLLPAAVVFFEGIGLILEHSLLADPLFAFLQAVGIYATIRALHEPRLRWPLLAGIAIGLSFWVKTAATSSAILIVLVLLCAAAGGVRRRLISAFTVSAVVIAMVLFYIGSQYYFTGYLGYERQSAWDVYGRVATFVDCSKSPPPAGTSFLCPPEPLGHRLTQSDYQYLPSEPAPGHFGPPWVAPGYANALLQKFSAAAIEHEPIAYAKAIGWGLGRYVFPREGEGYTPQMFFETVTSPANAQSYQPEISTFYPGGLGYTGSASESRPLSVYETDTRIQGPFLILLLICAIVGPLTLPRRTRWAAVLFTLTAIFSIIFSVAGNDYDVRYAYPTFGPLAAGAALGAWGIGSLLVRTIGRRREDGRLRDAPGRSETLPANLVG